jgi:hypothetical protein
MEILRGEIMEEGLLKNATTMNAEFEWLSGIIKLRMETYFNGQQLALDDLPSSNLLESNESKYATYIVQNKLNDLDRIILAVSLAIHFKPQIFDSFLIKNKSLDKRFTEFGGLVSNEKSHFVPTLETIAFIVAGSKIEARLFISDTYNGNHVFNHMNVIQFESIGNEVSFLSSIPKISDEYLQSFTSGKRFRPSFNSKFPARKVITSMDWEDLILSDKIRVDVENINTWITYRSEIEENEILQKKINKGYKCLFYGVPGTGKTLTATLIGKKHQKDVYCIDLSQVVSKYIGETEKNLANLFNVAEDKDWILFFDEAESLFSKRTGVQDSKDKYANQQTGYLLQRIENYNGLIILATNLKPNIDLAFSRRIQSIINFQMPDPYERNLLWTKAFQGIATFSNSFIKTLSETHKLSGGSIKNVIHYVWLLSKKDGISITENHVLAGIKKELNKDGKSFTK